MLSPKKSLETWLARLGFAQLSPMQEQAISIAEKGEDLVLISPTGSGKTIAFLIPLAQALTQNPGWRQALLIVPTRELALQIFSVWKQLGTGLPATLCYGGHRREVEDRSLQAGPSLIIGTPGRLRDHLHRGNFLPENIGCLVLDEFDKSLELGFQEEMADLISHLNALKQRILCSATEMAALPAFTGLQHPRLLHFSAEKNSEKLKLQCLHLSEKDKAQALLRLLCLLAEQSSVVFLNHRQAVDRLQQLMTEQGIESVSYHGALEQEARELALAKFRNGSVRTLLATDLAARGLDVAHIHAVIHYHLPADEACWTHRNGRTARMDAEGLAILLLGPEEHFPSFCPEKDFEEIQLPSELQLPAPGTWRTLMIGGGKKDKLSKADLVGFLTKTVGLKKEEIGLIEVKDFQAFVALRPECVRKTLLAARSEKLKGQKRRMWPAP